MFERGLGAIAVVDVEVDHRHPRQPGRLGHTRRHREVGVEAEAHGPVRFGMVARRPDGAEGPLQLARRHCPDGSDRRAGGPLRGLKAADVHRRIGVEPHQPPRLAGRADLLEIGPVMHTGEVGLLRARRLAPVEVKRRVVGQSIQHRAEPLGPLGMACALVVAEHGGVAVEGEGHERRLQAPRRDAKTARRRNRRRRRVIGCATPSSR